MRIAFATLLLAHGIAHLVGFLGAWAPTRTTIIGDRIDLGTGWIKLVGLLWLAGTITFCIAAIAVAGDAAWWPPFTMGIATASLILCLLQLPETKFGVVLNLGVLAMAVSIA